MEGRTEPDVLCAIKLLFVCVHVCGFVMPQTISSSSRRYNWLVAFTRSSQQQRASNSTTIRNEDGRRALLQWQKFIINTGGKVEMNSHLSGVEPRFPSPSLFTDSDMLNSKFSSSSWWQLQVGC